MTEAVSTAFAGGAFALTLFVTDLDATADFYGSKLGLSKVWGDENSTIYRCGSTMINLLHESAADELVAPAKVAEATDGVRAVYTLRCAEIDLAAEELIAAGVALLNGPIDRPWGVRTVSFQDPDGHVWELANHA